MDILEVKENSDELLRALNSLLPQLSSTATPLVPSDIKEMINSRSVKLLIAIEQDIIYGCLTLVTFPIPTGTRSWIEDVVVDEAARGKGVGKLLSEHAISLARRQGAKTVDLTSRPSRTAANELYKKIGFIRRGSSN